MAKAGRPKRIAIVLLSILSIALLGMGYTAAQIYAYGKQTTLSPAPAAIVLGAAVHGEQLTPVFTERINHGIALYHAGQIHTLIFTGGIGPGETIAESEAAKQYAIANGVPASAILLETHSRTTEENLRFALPLIEKYRPQKILIVSDPLHMKRAMAMAGNLRLPALPSPTPTTRYRTWKSQSGFLAHETYFYLEYYFRHLW